jgi:hypothetical protein
MLVLVARFTFAGLIVAAWALLAKAAWPTGRKLGHVVITGLLMQAVQFCARQSQNPGSASSRIDSLYA